MGWKDLDQRTGDTDVSAGPPRIFLLGFSWTASSLLEEIARNEPGLLKELAVIDFNPRVNQELRRRGVRAIYGDVSQRETLVHARIGEARSEEHTSELQSHSDLVCRLLLEKTE